MSIALLNLMLFYSFCTLWIEKLWSLSWHTAKYPSPFFNKDSSLVRKNISKVVYKILFKSNEHFKFFGHPYFSEFTLCRWLIWFLASNLVIYTRYLEKQLVFLTILLRKCKSRRVLLPGSSPKPTLNSDLSAPTL